LHDEEEDLDINNLEDTTLMPEKSPQREEGKAQSRTDDEVTRAYEDIKKKYESDRPKHRSPSDRRSKSRSRSRSRSRSYSRGGDDRRGSRKRRNNKKKRRNHGDKSELHSGKDDRIVIEGPGSTLVIERKKNQRGGRSPDRDRGGTPKRNRDRESREPRESRESRDIREIGRDTAKKDRDNNDKKGDTRSTQKIDLRAQLSSKEEQAKGSIAGRLVPKKN